MRRKIILLSDGTGNSSAKVWRTNVWRIFESLDLSASDQVAFYDDGVGTSSFKPVAIIGGAFGYGLKRNVIALYKFACRNYRSTDDEIYGFGFSRGAFTIRIVIWLILDQGLVKASSEKELDAKAKAAYRAFRKNFHTVLHLESIVRWIRDRILRSHSTADYRHDATVRFLGLWDTVAAYGMPVEEMTRGISQWIWPLLLPNHKLDKRVKRACHALSVDDERTTFHPVLWDERQEEPLPPRADGTFHLTDERISQVWFPGVHANVGGGYPDDSVSQISLIWMMSEAKNCGLRFKSSGEANPQTYGHPITAQDKDGRLYDPRRGLGGYYRYGPRNILELSKLEPSKLELSKNLLSRGGREVLPRIHESVLKRVENNAHLYAPKGLPARYEIVNAEGEVLAPDKNPFEHPVQSQARWNCQENVWNTIWVRRIVYFMTIGVSIYLFTFPITRVRQVSDELSNPLRWVSDIVRSAGLFLPNVATPWVNGYARAPGQMIVVGAILTGTLFVGAWLAAKIENKMGGFWQDSLKGAHDDPRKPTGPIYWLRTNRIYIAIRTGIKKYLAPAFFAWLFLYLALALTSHALFTIQDDAGWVCRETGTEGDLHVLKLHEEITIPFNNPPDAQEFNTSSLCQSTGLWLDANREYRVTLDNTASFRDGDIEAEASGGFYSNDPSSIWQKALMISAVPLRRELIRPWFTVVARIGGKGGEERFLDPALNDKHWNDKHRIDAEITAKSAGELFLFVNDAVIGIPRLYDLFYKNNRGSTKVTIERTR